MKKLNKRTDGKLSFIVAFDEAHKPRGRIAGNYSKLKELLESNGFQCVPFAEFPITRRNLAPHDILVVPCPDFSKFSKDEIASITKWVQEDGGGLVLLSHAGGDKGRRSNLSELAEQFGMAFENDQIIDKKNNFGLENMPEVKNFTPHPITEGIISICFRAGCSLSTLGLSAVPVIISSEDSEPFSSPLVVASEFENGRVVGIGSYEIFRDKIAGGINHDYHAQLALNIFNWVKTEYRERIHSGEIKSTYAAAQSPGAMGASPGVSPGISNSMGYSAQNNGSYAQPMGSAPAIPNISSEIQISDKSELAQLLYGLLNQAEAMRQQIQKIIEVVVASEEEIMGMEGALEMMDSSSFEENSYATESNSVPDLTEPPKLDFPTAPPQPSSSENSYLGLTDVPDDTLSPLPPKPPALLKRPDDFVNPSSEQTQDTGDYTNAADSNASEASYSEVSESISSEVSHEGAQAATPQIETLPFEEIQAEMESLQSKLKSLENLKEMVEKKHKKGKLNDKQFDKQIKRLENDKMRCFKRIDELEQMLKNL